MTSPRPLRALAGLMVIYAGGRVALASYDIAYPIAPVIPSLGAALAERSGVIRIPPTLETAAAAVPSLSQRQQPQPLALGRSSVDVRPQAIGLMSNRGAAPLRRLVELGEVSPAPVGATSAPITADQVVPPPAKTFVQPGLIQQSSPGLRLTGSAWALVRDGDKRRDLASTGTLGGSQLGARLILSHSRIPVFATVRASSALEFRDREVAIGAGVRGKAVGVIVEQRVAVDGSRRSETAALAYGGFSEIAVGQGFRIDGYAQAGVVGVTRRAAFADGALRAERTLIEQGRARFSAGGGVWGAAQPGVERIDVGPQLVARLPVGAINARLSTDYRLRVAGRAAPANGVALSLGADF